eukprot:CAMPEP_0113240374 /NCGR_PEP_ID=MMETSP0008_2-20120614/6229_1 /TAXON_ID=97485 /ORGANISM="Prymnesium parvum" /LENGTH=852 /DNA_ID=CAMNT_0000087711 /DNA_START=24 /DNA_END=2582 /DNA_ORIENTATION=- /assembly_acc=CAM_ASM_000153
MMDDARGALPTVAKGKIIDMVKEWQSKTSQPFISFEYFPPKTPEGVEKLHKTISVMAKQSPLFMDFTWGAGGTTSDLTLDLSIKSQERHGLMVNMHLTCTNQTKEVCDYGIKTAKEGGIRNIVALRGDPPKGQEKWEVTEGGFACALDLVQYIRKVSGDHFGVQVSGYPEGHPDNIKKVSTLGRPMSDTEKARVVYVEGEEYVCSDELYEVELDYLKKKIDAGGDCIITQLFYDYDVFAYWVKRLREKGIHAPVLPGIMPINNYGGFCRMTGFCKTRIPPALAEALKAAKDDAAAFSELGLQTIEELCKKLVAGKLVPGLHFYCLNQYEKSYQILDRLGYLKKEEGAIGASIAEAAAVAGGYPVAPLKAVEASGDFKVADMSLADFGRKELDLAEHEMPGLMAARAEFGPSMPLAGVRVMGSLHMTIQTAVLAETLQALGADVRWCSCNIFSTQDHAAAACVRKGTANIFAWKGETLEEYWWCTDKALMWPDGKGCDQIVDDGGDATLLLHEGKKFEAAYAKDKSLPDPATTDNAEFKCVLATIKGSILKDPLRFSDLVERMVGVSEETTTGVHRLIQMASKGELLFPAINVNDCVTKSKFDNVYGCRHSLPDGIMRATDVMLSGKKVVICGFGDVGKGSAASMKAQAAVTYVTEIDPICALQACMEGYQVVTMEEMVSIADVFITTTGNKDIITLEHMSKMKNNAIVGNIGHFDNEIQMEALEKATTRMNIKPQCDKYIFPDGHGVIVLAEGRLLNLGCATGHPSFVMSNSFTNQTLAQLELRKAYNEAGKVKSKMKYQNQVYLLPKELDEKVASLHLGQLGAHLTKLTKDQADYIGVNTAGPYKAATYRY